MGDIFGRIRDCGIVPAIRLERAEDARPLGEALLSGGVPVAEIMFRSEAAAEAIALLKREYPELIVGAGTVLTIGQLDAAIAAGASFAVAPGLNPRIVDACLDKGMPVIPGVNSPSQIEQGLERGLKLLKFFPAEASGGLKMLKALHGPYGEVSFMPTGGIDASNLASYLSLPYVAAVGGSWMAKEELIASGSWADVARLCAEAAAAVRAARSRG